MIYPGFPEYVSLPLIRMEADPEYGLRPEQVTRTQYDLLVYEYVKRKLGMLLRSPRVTQTTVSLQEMDGESVTLYAVLEKYAVDEFREFCAEVERYTYTPHGPGATSFGFYSRSTLAWIHPHRDGPVLLYRKGEEELVQTWMDYAADLDPVNRSHWPEPPERKVILAPAPKLAFSMKRKRFQRKQHRLLHG